MKSYCIDASIILALILEDSGKVTDKATILLREFDSGHIKLTAPSLLKYEVTNGLNFTPRSEEEKQALFQAFSQINISYVEIDQVLLKNTLHYSHSNKTTVYDTSYHVLALSLHNCSFITADKQYYKKASYLGAIELWE